MILAECREALRLLERQARPQAVVPLLERALTIVQSDPGLTHEVHGLLGDVYERWALFKDEVRHRALAGRAAGDALVLASLRAGMDYRPYASSGDFEVRDVVKGAARVLRDEDTSEISSDVLDESPRLAMLCAAHRKDKDLAHAHRGRENSVVAGFALSSLGLDDEAEEVLHAVVGRKKDKQEEHELEEALIEMAELYARTGRFVEAEGMYTSSLEYLAKKPVQTADVRRLRMRGTARFADLLRRLEWNGKSREREALRLEKALEKDQVHVGMLPKGDSNDLTFPPTWIKTKQ